VAVAALVGFLYGRTLAPTVLRYGEADTLDSAMLQAGVSVLGIGHPTGYPTYMMLTHLFTYLPVGDPAYRANLASTAYGVAAVFVVYLVGLRLGRRAVAAATGALAFGLSEVFWTQAVIAEVYALGALLVALVLFALLLGRIFGKTATCSSPPSSSASH
jgi:ABC-type microcin C transport system permease subunit YejB